MIFEIQCDYNGQELKKERKMRGKILIQNQGGQKHKIKVRYLMVAIGLMFCSGVASKTVSAVKCPDLRIVFVRGSGGERWVDANYLAYKSAIENKLKTTGLNYEFVDLDYPAIGISDPSVLLGAYFGAGEAYEFGESVKSGVKNLDKLVNSSSCPNTKYVIGGYSQGAMVVSQALSDLKPERIIYAATFGDPKIYLPEGYGLVPVACSGKNLSEYRMYVPDCRAYKGMLGGYTPYRPDSLIQKVGTWCNKRDIFCSSYLSISDHVSYITDDLYEDASRVIFDKICKAFNLNNTVSSPHDTAILIDSTGSMLELIDGYKTEALRLARKTFEIGGRVALYDYRDYKEGYIPHAYCNFETCTMDSFAAGLAAIESDGGDDTPESLLASSLHVMKELNWKQGSTKSIVILTDAGYHEPDYDIDGTTKLDVVRMSKQIDPVNFYIVTTEENFDVFEDLATATDGRVVTTVDDLSELTDYIVARYDSLPRVEEDSINLDEDSPNLEIKNLVVNGTEATVRFETNGKGSLVVLNDAVLGTTLNNEITITGLDLNTENVLTLIPFSDTIKGEPVEVNLKENKNNTDDNYNKDSKNDKDSLHKVNDGVKTVVIPKAPQTGKR